MRLCQCSRLIYGASLCIQLFIISAAVLIEKCPSPCWLGGLATKRIQGDHFCYLLVKEEASSFAACQKMCQDYNGNLPILMDQTSRNNFRKLARNYYETDNRMYIGLEQRSGQWYWVNGSREPNPDQWVYEPGTKGVTVRFLRYYKLAQSYRYKGSDKSNKNYLCQTYCSSAQSTSATQHSTIPEPSEASQPSDTLQSVVRVGVTLVTQPSSAPPQPAGIPQPGSRSGSSGVSVAAMVGIILGIIGVMLLLMVVVAMVVRRRTQRQMRKAEDKTEPTTNKTDHSATDIGTRDLFNSTAVDTSHSVSNVKTQDFFNTPELSTDQASVTVNK